ncbi:MAG TPA: cysteine desulfurase family protein [bacterium]|jgi:cysteine desulfurase|nr:cysteine desulfurase family protein [bacterium]
MIYLDNAATTPLDEKVFEAMLPYFKQEFGNPSSVHESGRKARAAIDKARQIIASTLNAGPKEIVFTSGATESVNAIHKGVVLASAHKVKHIITSAIEHHCVLDCIEWLGRQNVAVTYVMPNHEGLIDPEDVKKAIRPGETILISIMAANNEVGTIEPFAEIGQIAKDNGVLFHTDAVQGYGKIPIDVQRDHIDFLSVSAHKIYGPKGAGFFYQRQGVQLVPLVHGGGQESDLRGGTENVAGIVGLAEAAKLIFERSSERKRLRDLADLLWKLLKENYPEVVLNGPLASEKRVPGLLNVTFPGLSGEMLVQSLDGRGFAVSSGAACAAGSAPPSHVLMAMGRSTVEGKQGLRISLGHSNSEENIRELVNVLRDTVLKMKTSVSFSDD